MAASIYPLPILDITQSGTTYTVKARVDDDTDVYFQPVSYQISIINNTIGGELANIADVTMVNSSYSFTSHGAEDLVISVSAFFSDDTETTTVEEYTTVLVPITGISASGYLSDTITDNDDTDFCSVDNLTITPATASVLYGDRPKLNYEISHKTRKDITDYNIVIDEDGVIHTMDALTGEYEITITPADGNSQNVSLTAHLVVRKAVSGIEINNNRRGVKLAILSDGHGGYVETKFTVDNMYLTPTDATDRRIYFEIKNPISTPASIGSYTGKLTIPANTPTAQKDFTITGYDITRTYSKDFNIHVYRALLDTYNFETWWNKGYDTCPRIMTTMDFNAISFNVWSLQKIITGNYYYTNYVYPDDAMAGAHTPFDTLITALINLITNGSYGGVAISTIVDISGIPQVIPGTQRYQPPTQNEWNIMLDKMRIIREYILSH